MLFIMRNLRNLIIRECNLRIILVERNEEKIKREGIKIRVIGRILRVIVYIILNISFFLYFLFVIWYFCLGMLRNVDVIYVMFF